MNSLQLMQFLYEFLYELHGNAKILFNEKRIDILKNRGLDITSFH